MGRCHFELPYLHKSAEACDSAANNQRIHFAGTFVGVNCFGIGHEATDMVIEQDTVAGQQFAGIAHRLATVSYTNMTLPTIFSVYI